MEAKYGQSPSTSANANAFITPAKHRVSFGSTTSSARSHGSHHEDSSARKLSTPSSASSSRSLMHSGRSVRSAIATIPEKASPINATPTEFKRVKITPQRMDSPGGMDYDSKLKLLTDPKRIKVPSPEEKQQALSAMTHMFDEDEPGDSQVLANSRSPIVTPLPREGNSNPASSGASSVSTYAQSSQKSTVDRKDTSRHSPPDNYAVMFSDSSFLEDAAEEEPNTVKQSVLHEPSEAENPWINMLNAAVDAIQLNQPHRPPPIIPQQYHPQSPFVSLRQSASSDQPSFSSLVATLAQNHEKAVVSTPHTQATLRSSSSSLRDSFQATDKSTFSRALHPTEVATLPRVPRTPTTPKELSASVSQSIPDISLPVWTPTKSAEVDNTLQPYLDFLRELDREFFSVSTTASYRSGQDDVQRLWQRFMLLPVEDLQKQVFEQHQALADLGVFNQILSLEPDTTSNHTYDSLSGRADLTPVK